MQKLFISGYNHSVSNCSIPAKLFWGLVVLFSWFVFVFYFTKITKSVFRDKNRFTSVTARHEVEVQLPDITICSTNLFQGYLNNPERREKYKYAQK